MRWLVVLPFMLVSGAALAQPPSLLDRAEDCAVIDDAAQRHACFDALVPDLKKGRSPAVASVAKPSPAAPPQSALTAPVATPEQVAAAKAAKDTEVTEVNLPVKSITQSADGKYRFTMENGQIWKQTDTTKLRAIGSGPWTAQIREASLGSYLLTLGNSRAVRVQRMN